MRTFCLQTLGCKVNQYESQQIATLLRARGLVQNDWPHADLRIVNTCSVTIEAASKSRQIVRRSISPRVLPHSTSAGTPAEGPCRRAKVVVTGCWASSHVHEAACLAGVDAVLTHHQDVAAEFHALLDRWNSRCPARPPNATPTCTPEPSSEPCGDDLLMTQAGAPTEQSSCPNKRLPIGSVKQNPGTVNLPLLHERQPGHQRAFLKVQDGCDARCTYCIIPQLRPRLWSKPIDAAVQEARRLVDAGHVEIVLTGICLGAYGQQTTLRRRQHRGSSPNLPQLVQALCTRIPGLRRLRLSSLEPGDLTPSLISNLKSHPQVVPHFHLPLQSGSDAILRRMNRQYRRDDYLRMIDRVRQAFDRPAITTDIIVGFPGETDAEFDRTLGVVDHVKFIHIHAFRFSPRPGTAASRWEGDVIRGCVAGERIARLRSCAIAASYDFRRQFIGQTVELLVERPRACDTLSHGRSERYFEVWFDDRCARPGDAVRVTIDRVTLHRTLGTRQ